MERSGRIRVFELTAVIITAIGKFIFMDWLDQRLVFVTCIILFWSTYVFIRAKNNPDCFQEWGFRTDNFLKTIKLVFPFTIFSIVSCISIGRIKLKTWVMMLFF